MTFKPQGLATAIGSFPHSDPKAACSVILRSLPEIPLWPQLPAADFRESMEIQYTEGFPCVVLDKVKERMYFNTEGDITSALETFYENYMAENLDHFRISSQYSRGIPEMKTLLSENKPDSLLYFKTQVTGPITMGLGRIDQTKRAVYYDEILRDVIVKGIEMKALWLLDTFSFLGCPQICFVDEPILSAFGSSTYVSVQKSDVIRHLGEVFSAVQNREALAGAHCCGNTEWPILIDAGVDIISFDSYEFGETISYYPDRIRTFLERGGALAWGVVPTSEKVKIETPESLLKRWRDLVDKLAAKGISKGAVEEQSLFTPSCGTGSSSVEISERVFDLLAEVSRLART